MIYRTYYPLEEEDFIRKKDREEYELFGPPSASPAARYDTKIQAIGHAERSPQVEITYTLEEENKNKKTNNKDDSDNNNNNNNSNGNLSPKEKK